MGISYSIFPFQRRAELVNWLWQSWEIAAPPELAEGRYPTLAELMAVAEELRGYRIEFSSGPGSRDIVITGPLEQPGKPPREWAAIHIFGYSGRPDENAPVPNYFFEKGSPRLVLQIAAGLARHCGPQVVMYNAVKPALVTPDLALEAGLKAWGLKGY